MNLIEDISNMSNSPVNDPTEESLMRLYDWTSTVDLPPSFIGNALKKEFDQIYEAINELRKK